MSTDRPTPCRFDIVKASPGPGHAPGPSTALWAPAVMRSNIRSKHVSKTSDRIWTCFLFFESASNQPTVAQTEPTRAAGLTRDEAEAAVLGACVAELVRDVDERAEQPTVCPGLDEALGALDHAVQQVALRALCRHHAARLRMRLLQSAPQPYKPRAEGRQLPLTMGMEGCARSLAPSSTGCV